MSLRAFHLVFIGLSTAFTLGFAAWLGRGFFADGNPLWIAAAAGSLAAAAGMTAYGVRFYRRTRDLNHPGAA